MDDNLQELLLSAQEKLNNTNLSGEQKDDILGVAYALLDIANQNGKVSAQDSNVTQMLANVTNHRNLLALIHQQAAELEALKRISYNLTSSLELQIVLETVVTEAMQLIKEANNVHIFLYQDGQLRFGASCDANGKRNIIFSLPRSDGLTYTVAQTKQIIHVKDMRNHPLFKNAPEDWTGSIIGLPLMVQNATVGVMNIARLSAGGFSQTELRLMQQLANQAALAIFNARLHQIVSNQALSDTLTTLPNRRALDARLENEVHRCQRYRRSFAVLMLDLDGFKVINDTYGHSFGDEVLHTFSLYITRLLRSTDFLARYGGDEMTMILPEADLRTAQQTAQKIENGMQEFVIDLPNGKKGKLGLSGGISIYPLHGHSAAELLRAADEALYRAKKYARGTFQIAGNAVG